MTLKSCWIPILAAATLAPVVPVARGAGYLMYVGTSTVAPSTSKGIYAYRFEPGTGKLTPLGLAAETVSPGFLAVHPNHRFLYASNESGGGTVSAFAIDAKTGKLIFLNKVSSRGAGPAHVAMDKSGRWLAVAYYGNGGVAVFPVEADGKLGEATGYDQQTGSSVNPDRQSGPHAHGSAFSPDNRFLAVADLGIDRVVVYRFDAAKGTIAVTDPPYGKVPPGAGSRHLAFHPNGKVLYAVDEIGALVTAFHFDPASGALADLQNVSTLPADYTGRKSAAEIAVNRAGTVLYVSNRGHNSIAVFDIDPAKFKLKLRETVSTQGEKPRHFTLGPDGKYLLAANEDSSSVVEFRVESGTGHLAPTGETVTDAPHPMCIVFVPAP